MTSLKNEVLGLLKETDLLLLKTQLSSENHETLRDLDEISTELEYSRVYKQLLEQLDLLMNSEFADESKYDEVVGELDLPHMDVADEGKLLEYLKQIQGIRRLIIQHCATILPTLRAVHHVEGIPSKETNIRSIVQERDQISLEIIKLQKSIGKAQQSLELLRLDNQKLLQQSKLLVSSLPKKAKSRDSEATRKLKEALKEAKQKSTALSEEIQLLLVRNGVNWLQDPELFEIVRYCGEIYREE